MDAEFLSDYNKLMTALEPVKKNALNPFFNSKYADLSTVLEHIKGPVFDCGFVISHQIVAGENRTVLVTSLHRLNGGEHSTDYPLPNIDDPQKLAACVTYARRQSIRVLLNLIDEDDDGNTAVNGDHKQQAQQPPQAKAPTTAPSGFKVEDGAGNVSFPRAGTCAKCGAETTRSQKGTFYKYCQPCSNELFKKQ